MGKKKVTLTVKEISEMIGISNSKIYEMARMNQIPHIKVGNRIIFHEDVIREWMGEASVIPRGPLFTPLPVNRNDSEDELIGTRFEMHLTGETIRFIQTVLEVQGKLILRSIWMKFLMRVQQRVIIIKTDLTI